MSSPASDAAPGLWDSAYHAPVLAAAVRDLLAGAHQVLDGTLGGGGHALVLLDSGTPVVTGIDRDPEAIDAARGRLGGFINSGRLRCHLANYARLGEVPSLAGAVFDGILLDLGISSHQVDEIKRGFTFREGAPLDMRMGPDTGQTAAEILNTADEADLSTLFRSYGDEPRARRLAREVIRRRANRDFETSDDLVRAIRGAFGARTGAADFARLFQALRIAVNDELRELERALPAMRGCLAPGGVVVVISYHSGEDRVVKRAFRDWSTACVCPPRQPRCTCSRQALGETVTKRSITAAPEEVARNPRSRSARLRAWRSAR